jgi:hypothetical protein
MFWTAFLAQAAHQDADCDPIGRYGCDDVLGTVRFQSHHMRKVDGWQTLATKPLDQPIDLAD